MLCTTWSLQFYWYRFLAKTFPGRSVAPFLSKVAANQLVLAPIVLCSVFAWNLALAQPSKADQILPKIQRDLWPTMVRGWGFWVPAASINFWFIPLPKQVIYMSTCGLVWTTYLSFTSYTSLATLLEAMKKKK